MRSRSLSFWLALLPLLLAAVWLLHLAGHLRGDEPAPAAESCLVCLHLAGESTPLPSVPAALPVAMGSHARVLFFVLALSFVAAVPPRQGAPPLA